MRLLGPVEPGGTLCVVRDRDGEVIRTIPMDRWRADNETLLVLALGTVALLAAPVVNQVVTALHRPVPAENTTKTEAR